MSKANAIIERMVSKQVPELMADVLLINSNTNNPDLLEVIEDFR